MKKKHAIVAAVACAVTLLLAGCFQSGAPQTYEPARRIADQLDVDQLGKVVWSSTYGTGTFSNPPTLELIVRGGASPSALYPELRRIGFHQETSPNDLYVYWVRPHKNGSDQVFIRQFSAGAAIRRHKLPNGDDENIRPKYSGTQLQILTSG